MFPLRHGPNASGRVLLLFEHRVEVAAKPRRRGDGRRSVEEVGDLREGGKVPLTIGAAGEMGPGVQVG
jgi:hypothetical protein